MNDRIILFNLDTHYGLRDDTREIVASYRSSNDCLMYVNFLQDINQLRIDNTFMIIQLENCENFEIKANMY